jgi:hypothetical protein
MALIGYRAMEIVNKDRARGDAKGEVKKMEKK